MRFILILLGCLPFATQAQNFHLAVKGGLINYRGDLQARDFTLNQSKFMVSLGGMYDLTEHIAARTYFTLGSLKADDKKGSSAMQQRNLNFQTKLFEWELGAQYNFLSLNQHWYTPYIYAGVGLFHYKPYTSAGDGSKTYLQPLGTEGQGFADGVSEYKLTQFCVPVGLGVMYALNEDIRVGFEMGYRKIFTDYLDDVSGVYADEGELYAARGQTAVDLAYRGDEVGQGPYPVAKTARGNDKYKDGYYYMGFTVTIRSFIDQYKRIAGLPAYKKDKKVGCPANRF